MSKSLGNFVTINELLETEKFGGRKWPGEVLRLAMLMTHYREPIDFSVRQAGGGGSTLLPSGGGRIWRDFGPAIGVPSMTTCPIRVRTKFWSLRWATT